MTLGLLDLDAASYHADAVDPARPSLSASLAKVLLNQSPAHARAQHPRLNPNYQRVDEERFDLGTAVHRLFLEGESAVEVVYADSWRTKDAKEQREVARSYGRIPMLEAHWDECCAMVAALRQQCDAFPVNPPLFADGEAESVLVWEDSGVLCRARLDWLRDDRKACDDLKTAGRSANPEQWTRSTMWSISAHLQAAFYGRGLRAVFGVDPEFRFCVVETVPPYAMSVVALAPSALELANAQIDHALDIWKGCLETDTWPSYPQQISYAEAPSWEWTRWMEREAREEFAA